jgi:hypothetical protein
VSDLEAARRRLAKLQALVSDDAAAVGERRSARVRVADLLAKFPELEAPRKAPEPPTPPPAPPCPMQARRDAAMKAQAAAAKHAPCTVGAMDDLADAVAQDARDRLEPLLRDFLGDFGVTVSADVFRIDWFGDGE